MGGTTFTHLQAGPDVDAAYKEAVEDALHEHGHGGYTGTIAEKAGYDVVDAKPRLEDEAYAWAEGLMSDYQGTSRVSQVVQDKWGPAAAIPVVLAQRLVPFHGLSFTPETMDSVVLDYLKTKRLLKRGESLVRVEIVSYQQTGGPLKQQATGRAIVDKGLAGQRSEHKVSVRVPGSTSLGDVHKVVEEAARQKVRVHRDERIISCTAHGLGRPAKEPKVKAEAPRAKPKTRYVVTGSDKSTWDNGLETQAEARAYAVQWANRPRQEWDAARNAEEVYEVQSVTRREDGSPLVRVTRSLSEVEHEVTVVTVRGGAVLTDLKPDAWLFFGWAST